MGGEAPTLRQRSPCASRAAAPIGLAFSDAAPQHAAPPPARVLQRTTLDAHSRPRPPQQPGAPRSPLHRRRPPPHDAASRPHPDSAWAGLGTQGRVRGAVQCPPPPATSPSAARPAGHPISRPRAGEALPPDWMAPDGEEGPGQSRHALTPRTRRPGAPPSSCAAPSPGLCATGRPAPGAWQAARGGPSGARLGPRRERARQRRGRGSLCSSPRPVRGGCRRGVPAPQAALLSQC